MNSALRWIEAQPWWVWVGLAVIAAAYAREIAVVSLRIAALGAGLVVLWIGFVIYKRNGLEAALVAASIGLLLVGAIFKFADDLASKTTRREKRPDPRCPTSPQPDVPKELPKYSWVWVDCPTCGGFGKIRCSLCDGLGWRKVHGIIDTCNAFERCNTCGGEGKIKKKVRNW